MLKLENYEVMYIWFYKRHLIMTEKKYVKVSEGESFYQNIYETNQHELTLKDLWLIYERDKEWEDIQKIRKKCLVLIENLWQQMNMTPEQRDSFLTYRDHNDLVYLEQYLQFHGKKLRTQDQLNEIMKIKPLYK